MGSLTLTLLLVAVDTLFLLRTDNAVQI